jgi:hypothetical protein
MQKLNRQLAAYRDRLCSDVGLNSDEASKVATLVAAAIRFLSPEVKAEIKAASPIPISARLDELVAFQAWMDLASLIPKQPAITRTQVVVQNYVCFVYLKDACFESGRFEVWQTDLNFWQALSRGVTYAAYEQLRG